MSSLDTPLLRALRRSIEGLESFAFQDFVVAMMFQDLGADGFTDLRAVRDGGCDGLISGLSCAIACYGPQKKTAGNFRKKLKDDYAAYQLKWAHRFPSWRMYVNWDLAPEQVMMVQDLGPHTDAWGVGKILTHINSMPWGKRVCLMRLLHVDEDLIGSDAVRNLLDDLLFERVEETPLRYGASAPDIAAKIRTNYPADDITTVEQNLRLTVNAQMAVESGLRGLADDEIEKVKLRVLHRFQDCPYQLPFSARMVWLRKQFNDKYNPGEDDDMRGYIDGLLFVLFGQCLFGNAPPALN